MNRVFRNRSGLGLTLMLALVVAGEIRSAEPARAAACYSVEGAGWTKQCPDGASPPARFGAAMAAMPSPTSPASTIMVLFGGCGGTITERVTASFADGTSASADLPWCPSGIEHTQNTFDDTWVWEADRWRKVPRPPGAPWPHARWGASMAYDRTTGKVLLFGGLYQTTGTAPSGAGVVGCWGPRRVMLKDPSDGVIRYRTTPIASVRAAATSARISSVCFEDTWLFDGSTWTRASTGGGPPARFEHSMAGGPACSPALDRTANACGPRSGLVTVFSGCRGIGMVGSHGRPDLPVYFDCSTYAGSEVTYTVRDSSTGEVKERAVTAGDTWVWSGDAWTRVCPGAAASGGCRSVREGSFDCSAPRVEIFSISLCAPSARRGATMAYNPATGGMLLFGGYTYDPVWEYRGHKGDTWEWDADASCPDTNDGPRSGPCWRLIMGDWKAYQWATPLPRARAWAASTAAGLGGRSSVVMFGGKGMSGVDPWTLTSARSPRYIAPLRDTWTWLDTVRGACTDGTDRYDTTCWQPCLTCVRYMPAARAAASIGYDRARGRVVLFGGVCDQYCDDAYGTAGVRDDTWTMLAPAPAT